jgi:hypothetical protein
VGVDRESGLGARKLLFNVLAVLASPAEAQVDWLKRIGTYPSTDELAIELSDWSLLVPQLVELQLVDDSFVHQLAAVEVALDEIQSASKWSLDDLATSSLWERTRTAAGKALVQMMEPVPTAT